MSGVWLVRGTLNNAAVRAQIAGLVYDLVDVAADGDTARVSREIGKVAGVWGTTGQFMLCHGLGTYLTATFAGAGGDWRCAAHGDHADVAAWQPLAPYWVAAQGCDPVHMVLTDRLAQEFVCATDAPRAAAEVFDRVFALGQRAGGVGGYFAGLLLNGSVAATLARRAGER